MIKKSWVVVGSISAAGIVIALFASLYLLFWVQPGESDYESARAMADSINENSEELASTSARYYTAKTAMDLGEASATEAKTTHQSAVSELESDVDSFDDFKAMQNNSAKKKVE